MSTDWNAIRTTIEETQHLIETDAPSASARETILKRRADQLAERATPQRQVLDSLVVLTFQCGTENYALPVQSVQAVLPIRTLTPIPCVPSYYRGVMNWNSKIISILDIVSLFEGVGADPKREQFIVVASGAGLEIGLNVNAIGAVIDLPRSLLVNAQALGQEWLDGVSAVTADGLTVLNLDQLFRDPRIHIYEEA